MKEKDEAAKEAKVEWLNSLLKSPDEIKPTYQPGTLAVPKENWIELAAYQGNPYSIEWYRLNSRIKLLRWIRHLLDKTWFTTDMCTDFIDTVSKHFGWEICGVP